MKWPQVEVIWGCYEDKPLLTRYKILETDAFKIYLHVFHRSDEDRELHDHPWGFTSIILWNGYSEVRPVACLRRAIDGGGEKAWYTFVHPQTLERAWIRPLSIVRRPAWWAHRVELEPGKNAVSLVFVGRKSRSWGFFTRDGWRPWKKFVASRDCG